MAKVVIDFGDKDMQVVRDFLSWWEEDGNGSWEVWAMFESEEDDINVEEVYVL